MILWDTENDQEAIGYDGSMPVIDGDMVYVKELGCNCDPSSGNCCGGCSEHIVGYVIGESQYEWVLDQGVKEGK